MLVDVVYNILLTEITLFVTWGILAAHIAWMDRFKEYYPRFPVLKKERDPGLVFHAIFASTFAVAIGIGSALLGLSVRNELPHSFGHWFYRFVLSFVAFDFLIFVNHILQHKVRFLYQHHKVHHGIDMITYDTITGSYVDKISEGIIFLSIPVIFQFNIIEAEILGCFVLMHGCLTHCGRYIPWLDELDFLIAGPRYHALHHMLHLKHLGASITLWDRIYGTVATKEEKRLLHVPSVNGPNWSALSKVFGDGK